MIQSYQTFILRQKLGGKVPDYIGTRQGTYYIEHELAQELRDYYLVHKKPY